MGREDSFRRKDPLAQCEKCPLATQVGMYGRGDIEEGAGQANVVIVGEGPGRTEIALRQVFVGPSGKLLHQMMEKYPLGSFWLTNAALCAGTSAKMKTQAAECCKERLFAKIAELRPKVVVSLGNIPTNIFLGKGEGITNRRGTINNIEINGWKTTLVPTFHPAAILRNNVLLQDLEADFEKVSDLIYGEATGRAIVLPPQPNEIDFEVTTDYPRVLEEAERSDFAVLDLETTGLDMTRDKIICAVIATDRNIYLLPQETLYSPDFIKQLLRCKAHWSGHNSKFDRNFLAYQLGARVDFAFDSMLAHYLLDERKGTHGLKEICRRTWNAPDWERPIRERKRRKEIDNYGQMPREELYIYAANDGYWQRKLTQSLGDEIAADRRLRWLFLELLMPASNALSDMEIVGVQIDRDALSRLIPKYEKRLEDITKELVQLAGHDFNPRSPIQVAKVMFDELGLQMIEGRSTGAKNVLKRYTTPHPFVTKLLEFREANTIYSRYIKGLAKHLDPMDRIHTSFNLAGTVTGRLSSSNPNLQNIPSRVPEAAKDIRDLFVADAGLLWSAADFSQIELRMIALLSGDEYLVGCYQQGRDLHAEMAREIWGDNYTKAQRFLAKGVNFGLAYGRTVEGILTDGTLNISQEEAERLARLFFQRMPGVLNWIKGIHRFVREHGYIESPLGRRRHFRETTMFSSQDFISWEKVYREAVNMPPQSAASDATLYSLIQLHKKGFDIRLTVHDDIKVQGPKDQIRDIANEQIQIMSQSARDLYGDSIPFPASVEIGRRWGSLEEIN